MSVPSVSVVIPLFNKSQYVLEALNSVLIQSFRDWECIIINDGSTDNSYQVVQNFIETHPGNWSIYSQPNSGPSAARNFGISKAKGKYIAFLDADDFWHQNKLQSQFEFMENQPSLVMTLTHYLIFSSEKRFVAKMVSFRNIEDLISGWLKMTGFGGLVETTGMIRADLVSNATMFDTNLKTSEGLDLVLKWTTLGRVGLLKKTFSFYRISPNQLHKEEDLVTESMEVVTNRYSVGDLRENLHRLHSAYFELSSLRKLSLPNKLVQIIYKSSGRDGAFFQIFTCVLFRNIGAILNGALYRRTFVGQLNAQKIEGAT